MKKKTVGEEAVKLLNNVDQKQGIVDTQREIDKDYFESLENCVSKAKLDDFPDEFFVVVISKKERVLENVIRRYFVARRTLPTPDYDQTVWRHKSGKLDYIWTVPDHNTCQEINISNPRIGEEKLHRMAKLFIQGRLYHAACNNFNITPEFDEPSTKKDILT